MILINNIKLKSEPEKTDLKALAARALKTDIKNIKNASLYKKSVDARDKTNVHFNCSVLADCPESFAKRNKNAIVYKENKFVFPKSNSDIKPVIVGFGPAGMFAALTLARAGLKPLVLERGEDVDNRINSVNSYWNGGKLNPESNVQFGEGGAGTFSDGKLATGIKDSLCRTVIEEFVSHGANKNILYDAKPHIGTDILVTVVKNIRKEIISLGGEVLFSSKLTEIVKKDDRISAIKYISHNEEHILECSHLILAIGHSARDTFTMLKSIGTELCRKPFSVGVRIEHKQNDINLAQYGETFYENDMLPAADYKLAVHIGDRGVYTFCMCPGGVVVNAASEENTYVTNGMSYNARDKENANSALLVSVSPEDIEGDDVLGGIYLQREIEQKAYALNNGKGIPAERVGDFLNDAKPSDFGRIKPSVLPKAIPSKISEIYPEFIVSALKSAIPLMAKKLKGFDLPDAVLTAPETRSSCPIRIIRNSRGESSVKGVYPSGEGAGYAGGITSAAVDGIRSALMVLEDIESL